MPITKLYTLEDSNDRLTECVRNTTPFFISRLGDNTSKVSLSYLNGVAPNPHWVRSLQTNAGIYCNKIEDVELYANIHNKGITASTYLSCFDSLYAEEQNEYLCRLGQDKGLDFRVLEPFYMLEDGMRPWTYELMGKTVLVINPFVETFQKQMGRGWTFFEDRSIFQPGQKIVYYKSYNTLANNRLHKNWFDTFSRMCNDIKGIEFDVALLGCGGYGIPLSSYIKGTLKKSAIYVGGGLQLLFGVSGKRWLNHPIIKRESEREGSLWTRPSAEEGVERSVMIEGGCYW